MAKSADTKIVLCFKEGEPNLYDKSKKEYITLNLHIELCINAVKSYIETASYRSRPRMAEIWKILALFIEGCDGFCSKFSVKPSTIKENSFENSFSRRISSFLNELYPPEEIIRENALKKAYAKKWRDYDAAGFSYGAQKKAIENQMARKAGQKVY